MEIDNVRKKNGQEKSFGCYFKRLQIGFPTVVPLSLRYVICLFNPKSTKASSKVQEENDQCLVSFTDLLTCKTVCGLEDVLAFLDLVSLDFNSDDG